MSSYRYPREGEKCPCGDCGDNCICCPFGCTFTAPIVFAIFAVGFTWASTFSCHYFESTQDFNLSNGETSTFGVGLWIVQNFQIIDGVFSKDVIKDDDVFADSESSCVNWPEHEELSTSDLDGALRFARLMTMLSAWLGLISFCVFNCGSCIPLNKCCLNTLSVMFCTFSLMMILSLTSLGSEWCADAIDCTLNFGGVCAILAFLTWLGAGFTICCMRDPKTGPDDLRTDVDDPNTVEMTATPAVAPTIVEETIIEPDGTTVKVTRETVTQPDGSQTVTETREILSKGATVAPVVATPLSGPSSDLPVAQADPLGPSSGGAVGKY